jgi:hypothetical protein
MHNTYSCMNTILLVILCIIRTLVKIIYELVYYYEHSTTS